MPLPLDHSLKAVEWWVGMSSFAIFPCHFDTSANNAFTAEGFKREFHRLGRKMRRRAVDRDIDGGCVW